MSSGKGYEYLLHSVVAGDGDREMSSPLTRYYTESGCPPGTWIGTGLTSLDDGRSPALAEGDTVTEEHLARLLGEGIHPANGSAPGTRSCNRPASGLRRGLHGWIPDCAVSNESRLCNASARKSLPRPHVPLSPGSI
ncbi:relaxase domain-containing protein [Microbacterium sp. JB110]|uniref:relaxase domain-containing protein n=1 Tax=Microbacterium sp. JB110 TaxID=2024477 RepID=UPI0021628E38|nr:relaxase domain-containing protein [Microbacterium sp. JB110]